MTLYVILLVKCVLLNQALWAQSEALTNFPKNEAPELFIGRHWKVKADTQVGSLVQRLVAKDRDGDHLTFSLRPANHLDGSQLFYVDNTTGAVFLADSLVNKEGSQYYLRVAVSDALHLTTKDVWVVVVPASTRPPTQQTHPQNSNNNSSSSNSNNNNWWMLNDHQLPTPQLPLSIPINNYHRPPAAAAAAAAAGGGAGVGDAAVPLATSNAKPHDDYYPNFSAVSPFTLFPLTSAATTTTPPGGSVSDDPSASILSSNTAAAASETTTAPALKTSPTNGTESSSFTGNDSLTTSAVDRSANQMTPAGQWAELSVKLAPLAAAVVLLPLLVYAGWRARRVCVQRRMANTSQSSTMQFQKQFSLSSVDKMAAETSSTWKFNGKSFKLAKLGLYRSSSAQSDATITAVPSDKLSTTTTTAAAAAAAAVDSFEFPRQQLRVVCQLGEGCFGQVWKCEALNLHGAVGVSTVAVKTLKEAGSERERRDLLQELVIMKQLETHPHVVTLLGCCTEKDPVFVILEFVSGGTLQQYLRQSRATIEYNNLHANSAALSARQLTSFSHQIARGMQFLTDKGIIHRDLAARNVLVSQELVCKVADFGFARNLAGGDMYERKTDGRLPIRWMAPESLYDNIFTVKSDVWSFGVLLWEIVTLGSTPYPGLSAHEVMKRVRDGHRLEKPDHCRRELYNLMYYCWSASAVSRPSFGEIVDSLERLLLSETDYIELNRFPEHAYYNLTALSGEKI